MKFNCKLYVLDIVIKFRYREFIIGVILILRFEKKLYWYYGIFKDSLGF